LTVTNSYKNFLLTDLIDVTLSNVSVTNSAAQSGAGVSTRGGSGGDGYFYNVDVDSYATGAFYAMDSLYIEDVDLGSAVTAILPGGSSQTGNGPSGANAIIDTLTTDDLTIARIHPSVFTDITAGDVSLTGNTITSDRIVAENLDIGAFTITGCGWNLVMNSPSLDRFKSSASCSTSKNTVTLDSPTFTHTSTTESVIDGRNSFITVGESSISSSTISSANSVFVARARAGTDIVLIAVDVNGDDCADADGDTGLCEYDVTSSTSNPSMIYFGGLASARVYRDQGGTPVWKANHVVTATLFDDNDNELF